MAKKQKKKNRNSKFKRKIKRLGELTTGFPLKPEIGKYVAETDARPLDAIIEDLLGSVEEVVSSRSRTGRIKPEPTVMEWPSPKPVVSEPRSVNPNFENGTRVLLTGNEYIPHSSNPAAGSSYECEGTIVEIKSNGRNCTVCWDNGSVNGYEMERDLSPVNPETKNCKSIW